MKPKLMIAALVVASFFPIGDVMASSEQLDRPVIERLDDLPRYEYEVDGSLVDLMNDEDRLDAFLDKVRSDIRSDLEKYEIRDETTLQKMHDALLNVALLQREVDELETHIRNVRRLESKPSGKLTAGMLADALRRAWLDDPDAPASPEVVASHVSAYVRALPWEVVRNDIEKMKGQLEMISPALLEGVIQSQLQPEVDGNGALGREAAYSFLEYVSFIRVGVQHQAKLAEAMTAILAANQGEKIDIWPDRRYDFHSTEGLTAVRLAVWDTGVDTDVFADNLYTNPNERIDGTDTDGNGFVDDVHGIAYDLDAHKSPELLYPLGDATGREDELKGLMKGFFDIQAAVDSPEATEIKQKLAGIDPSEVPAFFEDVMRYGLYSHGTHVAGLAVSGNPAAEIIVARLTADHRNPPAPPTRELTERIATQYRETVAYLQGAGARVVNMSWHTGLVELSRALEQNGVGESADERKALAREFFEMHKEALFDAMSNAPEVLFVAAAGNDDNDVEFEEAVPPAFDLPNLMIVGAVDEAGLPTSFTSFGKAVDVYACGFELESYVPGGDKLALSGTSMSTPEAANLAAKLIAKAPALTPAEVIARVKAGCDQVEGDHPMLLIHPKRTVEQLIADLDNRASLDR